jgi:hypothetical protein
MGILASEVCTADETSTVWLGGLFFSVVVAHVRVEGFGGTREAQWAFASRMWSLYVAGVRHLLVRLENSFSDVG